MLCVMLIVCKYHLCVSTYVGERVPEITFRRESACQKLLQGERGSVREYQ